ncbi:MAG: PGF-CTERM sorting domain-containing protein [Thermoplasmatota archaeon]
MDDELVIDRDHALVQALEAKVGTKAKAPGFEAAFGVVALAALAFAVSRRRK